MIQTTVVGSYPTPSWLRVYNTRESLRDAMLAVIKTQELAGIDVVADGELYRWDINHAETNGMIDYFVRRSIGGQLDLSLDQLQTGGHRHGVPLAARGDCEQAARARALEPAARLRAVSRSEPAPKKFTVTSPYMLAKVLADDHYRDLKRLSWPWPTCSRAQVADVDAEIIQVDEANVTGHAEEAADRGGGHQPGPGRGAERRAVHLCYGNYGGQTVQKGTYARLVAFLNELDADHVVLEIARRPPRS